MKKAAVADLKAHLSEYLDQVKAGSEVLITDHGKPVARLVPASIRDDLAHSERQSLVRIGTGDLPQDFWDRARPGDSEDLVLKALIEERGKGR